MEAEILAARKEAVVGSAAGKSRMTPGFALLASVYLTKVNKRFAQLIELNVCGAEDL
jgi:hypothetical protein